MADLLTQSWNWLFSLGPSEFIIASFTTLILHEIFYFGAYLPYFIADYIPQLQKYKIQPDKINDKEKQMKCLKRILFNHFVIQFPMIWFTHPFLKILGATCDAQTFPTWTSIAVRMLLFFLIEDFYFYWVHRALHSEYLYKRLHKIHHEYAAPFGMAAEYAHPIESIFLGIGTIVGPLLLPDHLLTLWVWLCVRVFQTVEVHSGYNFPWSLNNWVPLWGGAEYHDYHHMNFIGNYASTFRIWDYVFGTDKQFYDWKAKIAKTD